MNADEGGSNCYTHSREFTHDGRTFRVRINDDRMTYTVVVSRDDHVIARKGDLGPETANCSPATLADRVLG